MSEVHKTTVKLLAYDQLKKKGGFNEDAAKQLNSDHATVPVKADDFGCVVASNGVKIEKVKGNKKKPKVKHIPFSKLDEVYTCSESNRLVMCRKKGSKKRYILLQFENEEEADKVRHAYTQYKKPKTPEGSPQRDSSASSSRSSSSRSSRSTSVKEATPRKASASIGSSSSSESEVIPPEPTYKPALVKTSTGPMVKTYADHNLKLCTDMQPAGNAERNAGHDECDCDCHHGKHRSKEQSSRPSRVRATNGTSADRKQHVIYSSRTRKHRSASTSSSSSSSSASSACSCSSSGSSSSSCSCSECEGRSHTMKNTSYILTARRPVGATIQ